MTDREALRSMLIYAQREAEVQQLAPLADILSLALRSIDQEAARPDRLIRSELSGETEYHGHFGSRRLQ